MSITTRLSAAAERLTPSEAKVARIIDGSPQAVAFGTLAGVAAEAATSGPTVVRLAVKLGFSGFADLQEAVRAELSRRLAPAALRVGPGPRDVIGRAVEAEAENVRASLLGIPEEEFNRVVSALADRRHRVWVVAATACRPVGIVLADQLDQLRDGVELLSGSEVELRTRLARVRPGDVVVSIDISRYERAVVGAAEQAHHHQAVVVALTDQPLSPLSHRTTHILIARAVGPGPFDSLVGLLAIANALAVGVAGRVHASATVRLRAAEEALAQATVLVDSPERLGGNRVD